MKSAIALLSLVTSASSKAILATNTPSVTLGGCMNSAIEAGTAVTFGGEKTTITSGDIGVSPRTSITGSYQLESGMAHRNDAYAKQCASDMKTAYSQAASQTCTKLIASDLGSLTFTPGVYCTPSGKFIVSAGTVTLDGQGNPYAEWVFQTESTLVTAGATSFKLVNNARAANVYWAIGSSATLGSSSNFVGIVLAHVSISFGSGSKIVGRGLAEAAVTFASGSQSDNGEQTIGLPAVYVAASASSRSLSGQSPAPSVNLGGCQNSALQAETTITFNGRQTVINSGNIGLAPGSSITGNYQLKSGTTNVNNAYAKQCMSDSKTAYQQASSQQCTHQIATDLSGLTLTPGVYCSPSGEFAISAGSLTLNALGDRYAEWLFQIEKTFITSSDTKVILENDAQAANVYWAIGTSATLGVSSKMQGNILAQVSITFDSGSDIVGRGLAQTAITFASGSSQDNQQTQMVTLPPVYVSSSSSASASTQSVNLRGNTSA